jgi:hypothetical protein
MSSRELIGNAEFGKRCSQARAKAGGRRFVFVCVGGAATRCAGARSVGGSRGAFADISILLEFDNTIT